MCRYRCPMTRITCPAKLVPKWDLSNDAGVERLRVSSLRVSCLIHFSAIRCSVRKPRQQSGPQVIDYAVIVMPNTEVHYSSGLRTATADHVSDNLSACAECLGHHSGGRQRLKQERKSRSNFDNRGLPARAAAHKCTYEDRRRKQSSAQAGRRMAGTVEGTFG